VSGSFTAEYGRTSFHEGTTVLYADFGVRNTGQYLVNAPLLVAIDHLSDPTVRVRGADGVTPDGLPYFDLTKLLAGRTLHPGDATGAQTLAFYDPNQVSFTYDLVFLSELNRAPAFTMAPDVEALTDRPYTYAAAAADPDGDALTFSLATGPA